MESILTILTPAITHDLTTLATAKDEMNITGTASDDRLARWIREASGFIRGYCDRTFAAETLKETWRPGTAGRNRDYNWSSSNWIYGPAGDALRLRRWPVTAIVSISEDDAAALTSDDYELDGDRGWLYRMSGQVSGAGGSRTGWYGSKLAVTYTAGYALLDGLPYGLETACLEILKHRQAARERDPMLKQQTIPGELEQQWWVPGANEDGVPATIRALLDPHRAMNV